MGHPLQYPGRGMHGELVRHIGSDIVSGRLEPGEIVTLPEVPGGHPASRTAFREVIKVLAAKGLVESRQRIGTRVRPRHDWNLLDPDVIAWQLESGTNMQSFREVIELRLLIEPAAARMAAERATPRELEKLAASYELMVQSVDSHDRYLAADVEFHQTIIAACHNDMIEQLALILGNIFRLSFTFSVSIRETMRRALAFHERVLVAVQDRNPIAAEEAMRTLITSTVEVVEHSMTSAEPAH